MSCYSIAPSLSLSLAVSVSTVLALFDLSCVTTHVGMAQNTVSEKTDLHFVLGSLCFVLVVSALSSLFSQCLHPNLLVFVLALCICMNMSLRQFLQSSNLGIGDELKAFMAVLLGGIALVNLRARSGGSCGGFGPLLGAVVASYTLVPCFRWGRVRAVVASLTVAMTMTVVLEQGYADVACRVLLSIVLMFFVGLWFP